MSDRLKTIIEIKQREIDGYGFCPDCHDKLDGRCLRCDNQAMRRDIVELRIVAIGLRKWANKSGVSDQLLNDLIDRTAHYEEAE